MSEAAFVYFEYGVRRADGTVIRDTVLSRKESEEMAERLGLIAVRREIHMTDWEATK